MTGGGRGIGLTVNVYRPGGVDAAMQAWIRDQNPEQVVTALHQQFVHSYRHAPGPQPVSRLPAEVCQVKTAASSGTPATRPSNVGGIYRPSTTA